MCINRLTINVVTILVGCLWAASVKAQDKFSWVLSSGGTAIVERSHVATDAQNNVYITASFNGVIRLGDSTFTSSSNTRDIVVASYTSDGVFRWARRFGGSGSDDVNAIAVAPDGIVIGGSTTGRFDVNGILVGHNEESAQLFTVKLNSTTGQGTWGISARTSLPLTNPNSSSTINGITVSSNGAIFVTGRYTAGSFLGMVPVQPEVVRNGVFLRAFPDNRSSNNNNGDVFVMKLNPDGTPRWIQNYGGPGDEHGLALTIRDDILYVTGSFSGNNSQFSSFLLNANGQTDMFVMQVDTAFNRQSNEGGMVNWIRQGGGTGFNAGNVITTDNDGNVYVGGEFAVRGGSMAVPNIANTNLPYRGNGSANAFVAKYQPNGTPVWAKAGTSIRDTRIRSLVTDPTTFAVYAIGVANDTVTFSSTVRVNTPSRSPVLYMVRLNAGDSVVTSILQTATIVTAGSSTAAGSSIAIDGNGNRYFGGLFRTNVAAGCTVLTSSASTNQLVFGKIVTSLDLVGRATSLPASPGLANGSVIASAVQGAPPYQYRLIEQTPFQQRDTFPGLRAGLYSLEVRDANGCRDTVLVEVLAPSCSLRVFGRAIPPTRPGVSNGQIIGSVTNLTGHQRDLLFSIDGINYVNDSVFRNLAPGNYQLIAEDSSGCQDSTNIEIPSYPCSLNLTAESTNSICASAQPTGVVRASVTGGVLPYLYSLNGGAFVENPLFTGVMDGEFTLVVRDSVLCQDTIRGVVLSTEPPIELTVVSRIDVVCPTDNTGVIEVLASGGRPPYRYQLNNRRLDSVRVFRNLYPAIYNITVVDSFNCRAIFPVTISAQFPIRPQLRIALNAGTTCTGRNDGLVVLNVTNGLPPYSFGRVGITATQDSTIFANIGAGTYDFFVIDANGCMDTVRTSVLPPNPIIINSQVSGLECSGNGSDGSVWVSAAGGTGPYQFVWSNNQTAADTTRHRISGLAPDIYTVTITDAAACSITQSFTITADRSLEINVNQIESPRCFATRTGNISLQPLCANPPYSYRWSNNATTLNIRNLNAGTYTVTVTDGLGCSGSRSYQLFEPNPLTVTTSVVNNEVDGASHGSITVNAEGGTSPYTYRIDNNVAPVGNVFSQLRAGVYQITVTDAKNCTAVTTTVITQPNCRIGYNVSVTPVSRAGGRDAIVRFFDLTNGLSPYRFALGGNLTLGTSPEFTGLSAGVYPFRIVDSRGCVVSGNVTVTEPLACSAPTGLAATNITIHGADLTWNPSPRAVSYQVYFRVEGTDIWSIRDVVSNTFRLNTATGGAKYEVRVITDCGNGQFSAFSPIIRFIAQEVCNSPDNISIRRNAGNASVVWTNQPNAVGYTLQYKTVNGNWQNVQTVSANATLTGLRPTQQYDFRVRTRCSNGRNSEWSQIIRQ